MPVARRPRTFPDRIGKVPLPRGIINIPSFSERYASWEKVPKPSKWLSRLSTASKRRNARTGKKSRPDFGGCCRGASGFRYDAQQEDTTIGTYPDDYIIRGKGEKRKPKRHVGNGSGKAPVTHCGLPSSTTTKRGSLPDTLATTSKPTLPEGPLRPRQHVSLNLRRMSQSRECRAGQ